MRFTMRRLSLRLVAVLGMLAIGLTQWNSNSDPYFAPRSQIAPHKARLVVKSYQVAEGTPGRTLLYLHKGNYTVPFSMGATRELINNFEVMLPPTQKSFTNPCWYEEIPDTFDYRSSYMGLCEANSRGSTMKDTYVELLRLQEKRRQQGINHRLRCYPYFFLIGVARSATTHLYQVFNLVPQFAGPAVKEPHFWDFTKEAKKRRPLCQAHPENPTFADYLNYFDAAANKIGKPDHDGRHRRITADFTPITLTTDGYWMRRPGNENRTEPRFTNAHYLHQLNRRTKFIVLMRNPVERVLSNLRQKISINEANARTKYSMTNIEEKTGLAIDKLRLCMRERSNRACAYSNKRFTLEDIISKGFYDVYVNDWLEVFPRDRFLFMRTEDYIQNPYSHIVKMLAFLELEPLAAGDQALIKSWIQTSKDERSAEPSGPIMFPDGLVASLKDLYSPHARRLAAKLEDPTFTWGL